VVSQRRSSAFAAALLALAACAGVEPPVRFATDGGDAWTFAKPIDLVVTPGACQRVEIEGPAGTVSASPQGDRVSVTVALRSGENRLRAHCRAGGRVLGVAEQSWQVRLTPPAAVTHPPSAQPANRGWIDRAVVYGIVPYFFGAQGFADVTRRLDDLASLGIDTLWLSPVSDAPDDDFGYAVTDHFRVRARFGSEADLRALIQAAHARGLKVIVDVVPNHVSEAHPYYADAQARGGTSPYYDFFARGVDGEAAFYFDWRNLKNLDFDHAEVRAMVTEAFAYWVRTFDVDGFRADAAWGPRERAPDFWPAVRAELAKLKPDLLLIAEASARDPYYAHSGFDAAYDWTAQLGEWAWHAAFEDSAHTAPRLRAAIERSQASPGRVLRFLNNNDTGARFIARYGVARTKLAAALLLTLPGVPVIYTGDEIGARYLPYDEGPPLVWDDPHDLRSWYRYLIGLRRAHAALHGRDIRFLGTGTPNVLAYLRPGPRPDEDVFVALNFGASPARFGLEGRTIELRPDEARIWMR
jgi:glycosidase